MDDEPTEPYGIRGPGTPGYYAEEIAKMEEDEGVAGIDYDPSCPDCGEWPCECDNPF